MDVRENPAADQKRVEVFPVALGVYDHHQKLDVEAEVQRVVDLLREVGGYEVPWDVPMSDRGADAVDARLSAWSGPERPRDTLLYWIGHGWSDGQDASLAHARSPKAVRTRGLIPAQLSEPVRARQSTSSGRWAIVVIDTCWSSRFVDLTQADIAADPTGADAVVLVGVSGDGATSLGRFPNALTVCMRENFRTETVIELWQLVRELDRRLPEGLVIGRRLGDAALTRNVTPLAASLAAPLDLLREIEDVVAELGEDERRHFLVKAQGAEEGEVCWFFEGRQSEREEIVRWLGSTDTGMLIVTGRAGSGKSALLGNLVVHSLPDLRDVLIRSKLVDPLPDGQLPPPHVFDDVINLTGMTLSDVVRRIAVAASLIEAPTAADAATPGSDLDWLVRGLAERGHGITLLVDGLDEAQESVTIARAVLRRVATVPGVRIVVGSRPSTRESPDHLAPEDENLLVALGARQEHDPVTVLWMTRDSAAMVRYVARRLAVARDRGVLTVAGRPATDVQIGRAAEAVCGPEREFLFARLAVYELLASPELLDDRAEQSLSRLLLGDHRDLFASAVARLTRQEPAFLPLLEALALAQGRGIPIVDGVWATIAGALTDELVITDAHISALLSNAEPYIAVDSESGQTVYRLAHRTFVDYFAQ